MFLWIVDLNEPVGLLINQGYYLYTDIPKQVEKKRKEKEYYKFYGKIILFIFNVVLFAIEKQYHLEVLVSCLI